MTTVTATGELIAFTDFRARWLHNGSEDGTDVILDSVTIGTGKENDAHTTHGRGIDARHLCESSFVGPVVTSLWGVTPVYVLSSAEFDATTITATSITVNGTTDCRSSGPNPINQW